MSNENLNHLHSTTDATVWAKEFCKNWPTALSQVEGREGVESEEGFEQIMVGWFANAIMAGVDSAQADKDKAVADALREAAKLLLIEIANWKALSKPQSREGSYPSLREKHAQEILALIPPLETESDT